MPIKPENRSRYPLHWKQLSEYIRFERAGNKCEFCGVENYSLIHYIKGNAIIEHRPPYNHPEGLSDYIAAVEIKNHLNEWNDEYKLKIVVLTVAHLDHQPENNSLTNLAALCQRCHNKYDKPHRTNTRRTLKNQLRLL